MSVSNIQTNLSALLNKAYSTDVSNTVADVAKSSSTATSTASESNAASSAVTLGSNTDTTPTYTAQGLMQQLRQYQLSNASLMFGSDDQSSDDSTGLTGLMGQTDSSDTETASQDWVKSISESPGKAAVLLETSKNNSLSTIFGGN